MNYAYVTILSTDNYYKGVIVLFESLKKTNPKYNKFVVVVNEAIDKEIISLLIEKGYIVKLMPKIDYKSITGEINYNSYWNNTFDKFNVFELTEYDKIVYLDSDMLIMKNIDELFDYPNMSAVVSGKENCDAWCELNSGMMVIEPKKGLKEQLEKTILDMNKDVAIGDQDVIEKFYDWKNLNLAISENYNLFFNLVDFYIKYHNYKYDDISIVHFIGAEKPWMKSPEQITNDRNELLTNGNKYGLLLLDKYLDLLKENTM